ncbi:MAG: bifunctional phosphopantothenoylcysteine decarboxylase/phosphopantothenate--cysteine ligase CoaBC [Bacteroidales bacterium]|nr:bifunctional phosphopantothenoylcysteine decarboxylase/phosphopantothenate--cysteine ligase CoaBC [Bacteroidales bacterium]
MLKNKHIILGITGGIAAYKSAMLLRLLVKAGAEVQVVMTPSAKEFITPVTLSALSGKPVVSEFFSANTGEWHSHVDLGLWADAMVIAPATACTLAKMATGVADNMLVTTYLSAKAPVFVAPAMDLDMMAHPTTTRNLQTLQRDGVAIIEAEAGELASHLVGKGRMAEPETIVAALESYFAKSEQWAGKDVLITAGPTYERIDPVRFIGNFSTGKMGYALAEEAAKRGANVMLVSGPVSLKAKHPNITVVSVESAREMHDACVQAWPAADLAIMCAAVADYAPAEYHHKKIKREGHEVPVIELVKNPDIAAALGQSKREDQVLVGFALETDNEQANALDKMRRKGLDFIALNSLKDADAGFGVDTNRVTLFAADGTSTELPFGTKAEVASSILNHINL